MNKKEAVFAAVFWVTQIVFVILKILKIITWKWLWIFTPSWGLIAFLVLIIILGVIVIVVYYMSGVMRIYWKHWRVNYE